MTLIVGRHFGRKSCTLFDYVYKMYVYLFCLNRKILKCLINQLVYQFFTQIYLVDKYFTYIFVNYCALFITLSLLWTFSKGGQWLVYIITFSTKEGSCESYPNRIMIQSNKQSYIFKNNIYLVFSCAVLVIFLRPIQIDHFSFYLAKKTTYFCIQIDLYKCDTDIYSSVNLKEISILFASPSQNLYSKALAVGFHLARLVPRLFRCGNLTSTCYKTSKRLPTFWLMQQGGWLALCLFILCSLSGQASCYQSIFGKEVKIV